MRDLFAVDAGTVVAQVDEVEGASHEARAPAGDLRHYRLSVHAREDASRAQDMIVRDGSVAVEQPLRVSQGG